MNYSLKRITAIFTLLSLAIMLPHHLTAQYVSGDTVYAEIVAIDQPLINNRLGAKIPTGKIYALKSDVEKRGDLKITDANGNQVKCRTIREDCAGCMRLKQDIRPRPIVLRANIGDHLIITLTNWLTPSNKEGTLPEVGFSANGMQLANSIHDEGSWTGSNANSQLAPNATTTYRLYAQEEGSFLIRDPSEEDQGQVGLFGSITIHPKNAEWYRSQVTQQELFNATAYYLDKDGNQIPRPGLMPTHYTPPGHPVINYEKLRMYTQDSPNQRTIINGDLTAIITGPNTGRFPDSDQSPLFDPVPASPDRRQPYREIAVHYHNTFISNHQAFPDVYNDPDLNGTLTGNDIFAINYGVAGITSEIYANRIGVGPMADCIDCAYEEFFLSSWAVGDPAMIVDIDATESAQTGQKATKAFFPSDPSNVYHSYMRDHVKFRINHAGGGVPHIHHQHAHQWLHSPNSDKGHYLDSQTINPGASWTLEMVYNGSGNRNQTVGDNIFHCHFYPHFASGMWGMWRVHDVLETGTQINDEGRPANNSRALPDGEIATGTPIPAIVPIPTIPMAPLPGEVHIEDGQVVIDTTDNNINPGFPFYIPGIAGRRAPHPPLDFAVDASGNTMDGGLPRHLVKEGKLAWEQHNRFDWTKIIDSLEVIKLPEEGTVIEKIAMDAHATRTHPSFTPEGTTGNFILNGQAPTHGAPFAAPYIDDEGNKVGTKRTYKGANIQLDVVLNKKGWHYPQQRIITLWEDVKPTIAGIRPPEPLFFRANTDEYIEYWQTNLVPDYFELDDFQVRTPTDIIGQHIHLVKFDVTASDGAANGWNYEDGTFSPDLVRERIKGIKNGGSFTNYQYTPNVPMLNSLGTAINTQDLAPVMPDTAMFGPAPAHQDWEGAQTTIQLWYADSLINVQGDDRTIRTVFTHDHFGPSTHQQIGLYAGLLVEPEGSRWYDSETGEEFGGRSDGGPTSFQAIIATADSTQSYREFALEFQDLQLAYEKDSKVLSPYPEYPYAEPDQVNQFEKDAAIYSGYYDPSNAINPPPTPQIVAVAAVQASGVGTYSVNYRNEPMTFRLSKPDPIGIGKRGLANGLAGDLSYAFSSQIERADPAMNRQPRLDSKLSFKNNFRYPKQPLTPGMKGKDPFTPLLRAYENDRIQIRTLVGAHEDPHIFGINGQAWLFEPSVENSGYRSTQMMSISEHFEMLFQLPKGTANGNGTTDYLYNTSSDNTGLNAGVWGMLRAYNTIQQGSLATVPGNRDINATNSQKTCGCPTNTPSSKRKTFNVSAVMVNEALVTGQLDYNKRANISDKQAIILVKNEDLVNGKLLSTKKVEPLVLRANAGDCITVNLTNKIDTTNVNFKENVTIGYPNVIAKGSGTELKISASPHVGLHAQLLSYDANQSDGMNVGLNTPQTASPDNETASYTWYAGRWDNETPTDIEFGTVLLTSSDPMEHYARGLFGAIIIEPTGATWQTDQNSNTAAMVNYTNSNGQAANFREFVIFTQGNMLLQTPESSQTSGLFGINYKTEPLQYRYPDQNVPQNTYSATSNALVGGDPETPVFTVAKGTPVRIRLLKPGGAGNTETFILNGHGWYEEPYQNGSQVLGDNDTSQWLGSRPQLAALNNFDLLIDKAGGEFEVAGDYLFRTYQQNTFAGGMWGIMRVTNGGDEPIISNITTRNNGKNYTLNGISTVDPQTGQLPSSVSITLDDASRPAYETQVNSPTGNWAFTRVKPNLFKAKKVTITTNLGGSRTYSQAEIAGLQSSSSQNPLKEGKEEIEETTPLNTMQPIFLKEMRTSAEPEIEGER